MAQWAKGGQVCPTPVSPSSHKHVHCGDFPLSLKHVPYKEGEALHQVYRATICYDMLCYKLKGRSRRQKQTEPKQTLLISSGEAESPRTQRHHKTKDKQAAV